MKSLTATKPLQNNRNNLFLFDCSGLVWFALARGSTTVTIARNKGSAKLPVIIIIINMWIVQNLEYCTEKLC